ncbi:MAG: hypothetical protein U0997_06495 [Sulfurimicrobium sp.]|nr:hypothetical protein [Sulfurimicrobium sp.]
MVQIPLVYKLIALSIAMCLSVVGGFSAGYRHASNKHAAEALDIERAASARYRAEIKRADELAAQLETVKTQTRTVTKTIVRKVNHYVTPLSASRCSIPLGFVRLHNAAAENRLPEAPGLDADAASGVDLAAVAGTVAENYGECHAWRDQLNALIDWHRGEINDP